MSAADIGLAAREGYVAAEHAKRYTTLGMATDQGKTANVNGLAILAEARGDPIPEVGITTFRPPYTPVAIGSFVRPCPRPALSADPPHRDPPLARAPRRRVRRGRALVAAAVLPGGPRGRRRRDRARGARGPALGRTVRRLDARQDRPAGPDAAAFLDRLYVNGFSGLAVGRARYGLMLREDGIVFDDGTTSRLGEHHFLMTTTTANAAAVLAHMELYAQTVWPGLAVRFCSVTEQWAAMALPGPRAREVLGGGR